MSTSKNGKLQFESGQTAAAYTAMTDSGDHKIHSIAAGTIYSGKSGFEPIVRPNGMVSGRNVLSVHATEETVTVAAFTFYLAGVLTSVAATTALAVRGAEGKGKISSITATATDTLVVVQGVDSATAAVNDVRGSAGGPPAIPVASVEIGQVRFTSSGTAVVTADEIFQVVGTHAERFDYPSWLVNPLGDGDQADTTAEKNAFVEMASALPLIHGAAVATADDYKAVYLKYYTPIFIDAQKALDFKPAENSHSISSTQYYDGTIGSASASLGQGGFTALMSDNVTDALLSEQDEVCTVKYFPDRNKAPYILTQGALGVARTFPVDNQNKAVCTISAETKSANFTS